MLGLFKILEAPPVCQEEYIMNKVIRAMNEWTEKTESHGIQDNVDHYSGRVIRPTFIHTYIKLVKSLNFCDAKTLQNPRSTTRVSRRIHLESRK